jgi:hypothetical protein
VVAKLNAEFNKALQQPELKKRLGDEGADPLGGTPEQFAQVIRDDITRWGKIVKESGVKSTDARAQAQACRGSHRYPFRPTSWRDSDESSRCIARRDP